MMRVAAYSVSCDVADWLENMFPRVSSSCDHRMVRFFFAASVGFAVPVGDMFSGSNIWKGFILGIGPCISMKVVSGPLCLYSTVLDCA